MGLREYHAFTNERYSQWPVLRRSRNAFRRDRWPLTMFSGKISMQVVAHVISAYWPHDGKYLRKSDFPNAVSFSTTQKPGRYGDCCFLAKPLFSNCHTTYVPNDQQFGVSKFVVGIEIPGHKECGTNRKGPRHCRIFKWSAVNLPRQL